MKKLISGNAELLKTLRFRKILKIMRNALLLLFFTALQTFAYNSYSQNTLLSLDKSQVSVKNVLYELENQSEFFFLYNSKLVNDNRKVDAHFEEQGINDILINLFAGTNVDYVVIDRQIILSPKEYLTEAMTIIQPITITGTITDETGQSLPGVNIFLKGTSTGTISDHNGNYTIEVPGADAVLVFSYIGFRTQEVSVGSQTQIDLSLIEDIAGLEEVIVIGYGTVKKSDLTGNVTRVRTEQTIDIPNTNILQVLKGSVAGLSVGTPDRPGESPSLKVRGINSLSAGNSPLIVIDGIIYNGSLNNISVGDIESVDILKDASAAAVYGSRSANGVLIVTTKKGTSEKPVFNFNSSYGMSNPVSMVPLLSPDEYIQKILDYRVATGQEADPANIHDYLTITESNNLTAGKTIDWYDRLVQTSVAQNYNGSVSGRTDKTNYFISGTYNKQEGIVQNDDFTRITARANFSNKITDWFTVSLKSSFSNLDYSGVPVGMYYALSPYSNWYEGGADSGELEEFPMEDPYFRHPYMNLEIDDHDVRTDLWGVLSTELELPFIDGLKWTMNYSLNQRIRNSYRFTDNRIAKTQNGSASKQVYDNFDWTLDNILNYKRVFNDVHSVDATFLYSREYQRSSFTGAYATNFFSQALGYHALELGAVPTVSSGFGDQNQTAFMGRLNYILKNTYAITGTVRRDGFSGFAEDNKYGTFYSGAFAWTLSNEAFMQNITWLDRLKLRLSYGQNGNQAIGRYQTLARMSQSQYVFGDGGGTSTGVYVSSMANSSLGWETTEVINLGLDFGIGNNLLYGNIDVYSSDTENVLLRRNIPATTGFTSVWTNIGKVHNKGIELALNSTPVKSNDFSWDIGFVFDINRNSIVSLFGADEDDDGIEDDNLANNWFIGEPLGVYYGYDIDGIHQTGDSDIPDGYEPGDFRIVDYDGDGELTADDRFILGYTVPNYQFSISNSLKYKNWSLYVMVNSIQGGGNNYYMGCNIPSHNPNNPFNSWTERFSFPAMDYWTPTNPSNTAARINYQAPRGHAYLEDRSFVRIQDLTLSYSFDSQLLNKWHVDGLRLFVSGKNLYTFTKWTGYDPENATTINGYPLMRTFTFGVDLKF